MFSGTWCSLEMITKFVSGSLCTLSFTHAFSTSCWALPCGCLMPNLPQTLYPLPTLLLLLNNHPCHPDGNLRTTWSCSSLISHIQQLLNMPLQLYQSLPDGPLSSCPRTYPSSSYCRERRGPPSGRGSRQWGLPMDGAPRSVSNVSTPHSTLLHLRALKAKFWPLFCLKVSIISSPPSE